MQNLIPQDFSRYTTPLRTSSEITLLILPSIGQSHGSHHMYVQSTYRNDNGFPCFSINQNRNQNYNWILPDVFDMDTLPCLQQGSLDLSRSSEIAGNWKDSVFHYVWSSRMWNVRSW